MTDFDPQPLSDPTQRDTRLVDDGRARRAKRRRARTARSHLTRTVMAVVLLVGVSVGWKTLQARAGSGPETGETGRTTTLPGHLKTYPDDSVGKIRAQTPATPIFARHGSVALHLPVRPSDLTEVGFHQASYPYALKMKTQLPDADGEKAKKDKTTHRDVSTQPTSDESWLVGSVLRMWRNRPGKPDTAADVGADPGADVFSPVDGTVVLAKNYKLYEKYDDFVIHIQPTGHPELDVVLIHVSSPTVKAGDKVVAGKTRIASIRKIPKSINPQLRHYTANGGYHTHIQVNDTTYEDYKAKSLQGALTVDANGDVVTP